MVKEKLFKTLKKENLFKSLLELLNASVCVQSDDDDAPHYLSNITEPIFQICFKDLSSVSIEVYLSEEIYVKHYFDLHFCGCSCSYSYGERYEVDRWTEYDGAELTSGLPYDIKFFISKDGCNCDEYSISKSSFRDLFNDIKSLSNYNHEYDDYSFEDLISDLESFADSFIEDEVKHYKA